MLCQTLKLRTKGSKNLRRVKSTKEHQKKLPRCSRLLLSRPRSHSISTTRFVFSKSMSEKILKMSSRFLQILSYWTRDIHQMSSLSCRGNLTNHLLRWICWSTITLVQVRRQRKAHSLIDLKSCSIKRRWDLSKKSLQKSLTRGIGWLISMKMNSKRSILSFLGFSFSWRVLSISLILLKMGSKELPSHKSTMILE